MFHSRHVSHGGIIIKHKIQSAFYWSGIQGDVACKSCDVGQKTVNKGSVPKVPLEKMPLIDKPFNRLSPESGNRKKVDMQRLSPRFRSQQFSYGRYPEKRFPQICRDFYGAAMLVSS